MRDMAKTRVQKYIERYSDQMVRFNPFAIKKTGLQQPQTLLQLEDYFLICSPFQLSMGRAIMLIILSRDEVSFFQRYQSKLCRLNFTFLKPGNKIPINFFVRATLERIGAVKGRQNVCMADLSFKACPNDLALIIGDYITSYGVLKTQYVSFKDRMVDADDVMVKMTGMTPEVDGVFGQLNVKVRILGIAANKLVCLLPSRLPGLKIGAEFSARLVFALHQYVAALKIVSVGDEAEEGYRRVTCTMDFYAEMVEVLDDYFYKKNMRK